MSSVWKAPPRATHLLSIVHSSRARSLRPTQIKEYTDICNSLIQTWLVFYKNIVIMYHQQMSYNFVRFRLLSIKYSNKVNIRSIEMS